MRFNGLKRKSFFWLDKLQVSRNERVAIAVLLVLLAVTFSLSLMLTERYNYQQEKYDAITAEFARKSAVINQQKKGREEKYNPPLAVKNVSDSRETEPQVSGVVHSKISINTASSEELQTLKGIGETYALRIIEYRERNGGFNTIEELDNVKGIGAKRLENLKPYIKL